MHPCLQTPELLLNIFQFIYPDDGSDCRDPGNKTLAHLARTCRTFTEPALDVLWGSMASLQPLIQFLPEHATYKEDLAKLFPGIEFPSHLPSTGLRVDPVAIRPWDFDQFLCYATRIKNLNFNAYDLSRSTEWKHHGMDDAFYEGLVNANPNPGPLLPNIRELSISAPLFVQSRFLLRLVCGQSLKVLNIRHLDHWPYSRTQDWIDEDGAVFAEHLNEVIKDSSLSNLSLPMVDEFGRVWSLPEPAQFIISMPPQFYRLRNLDLQAFELTGADVARIGQISGLENLTMSLDDIARNYIEFLPAGCFASLREVKIMSFYSSSISGLVKQWGASGIESFMVKRISSRSFWDLNQLFQDLGRQLNQTTLNHLALEYDSDLLAGKPYNLNTSDLSFEALGNLLCFNNLTYLSIWVGGRVTLCDSDLPKIAQSMPRLHTLNFRERENSAAPSLVTPCGIYQLVSSLCDLRHLVLRFNATTNFPDAKDITPQKLEWFFVCESGGTDSGAILAFLAACFPLLRALGIGWAYADCDDYHEMEYEDEEAEEVGTVSYKCWEIVYEKYHPRRVVNGDPRLP